MRYGDTVKYNGRYFVVGIVTNGAVQLWDDEDNDIIVTADNFWRIEEQ